MKNLTNYFKNIILLTKKFSELRSIHYGNYSYPRIPLEPLLSVEHTLETLILNIKINSPIHCTFCGY
jgi:hypothetical protein